jgi:hypothetical protein
MYKKYTLIVSFKWAHLAPLIVYLSKWRPALQQAWTKAPIRNQGRFKQKSLNKKPIGHDRKIYKKLLTSGCSTIKTYVAALRGSFNQHLEK